MEWSANYFDTIQPADTEYRYNAERKKSKYVTYDIFGGVNYKIDLRNPKGSKIVDLTLADGKLVTDDMKLKVGMNSYRFAQLNGKGGIWEGQKSQYFGNLKSQWAAKRHYPKYDDRLHHQREKGKIDGQSHNRWEIIGLN